jgi:hypothetical protein
METVKIYATIGVVAIAVLYASGTASMACGNAPHLFRSILPTLRKAAFPVLLPTEIDGARLHDGNVFPTLIAADAHHYIVQFE